MSERLPAIFLSHSHADNAFCDSIYQALTAKGFDVWYDNQSLPSGGILSAEIQRQLEARPVLIPLLSPASVQSYWVNLEIDAFRALVAHDTSRVILPIVIQPCQVPIFLQSIKFIDITKLDATKQDAPTQNLSSVVEEIVRSLSPQAQHRPPAPPVTVTPARATAAFQEYLADVERHLALGNATEHTHRPALAQLLQTLAPGNVIANEPKRSAFGAPDLVVAVGTGFGALTIGYVETKDIGKSLDDAEKSEQLHRYQRALDNLVLTNYLEFRWYKNGQTHMAAHLASRDAKGKLHLDPNGTASVTTLLSEFMSQRAAQITSPKHLAERMARLAHMIRDIIVAAFAAEPDPRQVRNPALRELSDLYKTLRDTLIPDLMPEAFADMFAQTIAYGLFAARYNHKGEMPFSRLAAAQEIPRTNPFLKRLFRVIGNAEDDAPYVGFVDDLAQMLAQVDMAAVLHNFGSHKKTEDPIVHFYETFLTAYDPKLRELRGVYYTPEPVVAYIVRSVDQILKDRFDCADGLADRSMTRYAEPGATGSTMRETPRALILDPACGTGTFLYAIIDFIRDQFQRAGNAGMWRGYIGKYVLERIFGFELLMAPYAMAHLKLGMQLAALDLPEEQRQPWAYAFEQDERLGIYLTNTLGDAATQSETLGAGFVIDEAAEGARLKKEKPVMVIVGNPPYSGHSANQGEWITRLMRGEEVVQGAGKHATTEPTENYFKVDGQPLGERNPKWLNNDYVKFIRFAQWRIARNEEGVVAYITDNGYLDNPTFRGMRQSLMQTFDEIYVLDLHGNSRKKERSPDGSPDQNVFDIQQGVAIGIFVKRKRPAGATAPKPPATVQHAQLYGTRAGKYAWLFANDVRNTEWVTLAPQAPFYLFTPQNIDLMEEYGKCWKITDAMPINALGFQTHRDHFAIDFEEAVIQQRFAEMRNPQISDQDFAQRYHLEDNRDWQLARSRKAIQSSVDWQRPIIHCHYRPFDWRWAYFDEVAMDYPRTELRQHMLQPNLSLNVTRQTKAEFWRNAVVANTPTPALYTEIKDGSNVFPLYLYPDPAKPTLLESGPPSSAPGGRRPNLAPDFVAAMAQRLGLRFVTDGRGDLAATFGPEDVFNYMYAIFHAPTYRERYAEFLKIDFPRVPLTADADLFRELCDAGGQLVRLHTMEQRLPITTSYPVAGNDSVDQVRYTAPGEGAEPGRVWINATQYFAGVAPEVWEFHIGGYQVCQKWLKDRKGRTLSYDDLDHYQRVIAALAATMRLMDAIDEAIDEHGGWPIELIL